LHLEEDLCGAETNINPKDWQDIIMKLLQYKRIIVSYETLWNQGIILGYLSDATVHRLLSDKQPGTFLLRFGKRVHKKPYLALDLKLESDLIRLKVSHDMTESNICNYILMDLRFKILFIYEANNFVCYPKAHKLSMTFDKEESKGGYRKLSNFMLQTSSYQISEDTSNILKKRKRETDKQNSEKNITVKELLQHLVIPTETKDEYIHAFEEFGVDFADDVKALEKEDWAALKVKELHRRKIMKAAER